MVRMLNQADVKERSSFEVKCSTYFLQNLLLQSYFLLRITREVRLCHMIVDSIMDN